MANTEINHSIKIFSPVGWVWNALTDQSELENWWSETVVLEPKTGGKFKDNWIDGKGTKNHAKGKVLKAKKDQHIVFTWIENTWPPESETLCEISLAIDTTTKNNVLVTVKHSGWDSLPEKLAKKSIKDFKEFWTIQLKELKDYLEE